MIQPHACNSPLYTENGLITLDFMKTDDLELELTKTPKNVIQFILLLKN